MISKALPLWSERSVCWTRRHETSDYNMKANEGVWGSTTGMCDDEAMRFLMCRVYISQHYADTIEIQKRFCWDYPKPLA